MRRLRNVILRKGNEKQAWCSLHNINFLFHTQRIQILGAEAMSVQFKAKSQAVLQIIELMEPSCGQ